jgi:hypothetical protein
MRWNSADNSTFLIPVIDSASVTLFMILPPYQTHNNCSNNNITTIITTQVKKRLISQLATFIGKRPAQGLAWRLLFAPGRSLCNRVGAARLIDADIALEILRLTATSESNASINGLNSLASIINPAIGVFFRFRVYTPDKAVKARRLQHRYRYSAQRSMIKSAGLPPPGFACFPI